MNRNRSQTWFRLFVLLSGLLLALVVMIGCTEDGGPAGPSDPVDGVDLLGLEDGRRLIYLRLDSIRDDDFNLQVTEAYDTFLVTGTGEDWSIGNTAQPVISLKVTDLAVIQNGYWPLVGGNPDIVHLPVPPVLMPRSLSNSGSWGGYCPQIQLGTEEVQHLFYYSYFGFHHTKSYVAYRQVNVPAGSFTAFQFNVNLYQFYDDTDPVATVLESYVPEIGLIQLTVSGGSFKRILSLVSYQ